MSKILEIERNMGDMFTSSVCVMKLVGTILENCLGKIDDVLSDIIGLISRELEEKIRSKIYKSAILQAFSMCFVYNTTLTYQ